MKTIASIIISLLIIPQLYAQEIIDIQGYARLSGTRIIAITDQGNRIYMDNKWKDLPTDELPKGEIKFLDAYQKLSGPSLMAVLEDETIWSFNNEEWTKLSQKGLPENYVVKVFKPYAKFQMVASTPAGRPIYGGNKKSGRAFVALDDNSLYRFTENGSWESLHKDNLPSNIDIQHIGTFQKPKMMGFKTGIVVTTSDQSIYYRLISDKKWSKYKAKQLPEGYEVQAIDAYLKNSVMMGRPEGRVILALKDGSVWWTAEKDDNWSKLEVKGLPDGYKIKTLKVFQKGLSSVRVLVLLEDNTIWWYADNEFQQVDTTGLWK